MVSFLKVASLFGVLALGNGFSLQQQQLPVKNGIGAPPQTTSFAQMPLSCRVPSSSVSRLHMSDIAASSNEGTTELSSSSTTTASSTQLSASVNDLVMEPDESRSFGERLAQQVRQWQVENVDDNNKVNWNQVINTSIVALISMAVLFQLATVDGGMTHRGWSVEESVTHMVTDNWDAYLTVLRESPVATKAVTSATVYTIGDVLAQRTEGNDLATLDRARTLRSLLAGLIGHGPLSHYWYNISEDFFEHVLHWTQWWSFLPKVAVDQALYGPFWNGTYILLLGLMKLESLETIWADVKRSTIPLMVSGLKLWPLAHCITYGLIPVENRLLWVDMVEIFWVTILATQAAGASADHHQQHVVEQLEVVANEPASEPILVAEP